jgi:chemotaxis protein histidine kinase CheA
MSGSQATADVISIADQTSQALQALRVTWEKTQTIDAAITIPLMRSLHTLKGLCSMAGLPNASQCAHQLESTIQALVHKTIPATNTIFTTLEAHLTIIVGAAQQGSDITICDQEVQVSRPATTQPAATTDALSACALTSDEIKRLSPEEKILLTQTYARGSNIFMYTAHLPARALSQSIQSLETIITKNGTFIALVPTQATYRNFDYAFKIIWTSDKALDACKAWCTAPGMLESINNSGSKQTVSIPLSDAAAAQITEPLLQAQSQNAPLTPDSTNMQQNAWDAYKPLALSLLSVPCALIDALLDIDSKLHFLQTGLQKAIATIPTAQPLINQLDDALTKNKNLLIQARLLPVEKICTPFAKLIKALAQQQGKTVSFRVEGTSLQLDKTLVEYIEQALLHMLKNALDHGIELPSDRTAAGKPAQGSLALSFKQNEDTVTIVLADDGRGIDCEAVRAKAIERGLVDAVQGALLEPSDIYSYIFVPGLSTKQSVTTISGRGVGLDAVKELVEKLRGSITIASQPGKGTTFTITIPASASLQRLLRFSVDDHYFAAPVSRITHVIAFDKNALNDNDGIALYSWNYTVIPALLLAKVIHQESTIHTNPPKQVIIVTHMRKSLALLVDAIGNQEMSLLHALTDMPEAINNSIYAGHVNFGDDKLVAILDIENLFALVSHEKQSVKQQA